MNEFIRKSGFRGNGCDRSYFVSRSVLAHWASLPLSCLNHSTFIP